MFQTPLFDDNKPTEALQRLMHLTCVAHDGTLKGIHASTQGAWRQTGVQTGNIVDEYPQLRDEYLPLFQQLGFTGERLPTETHAAYWLVGGAFQLAIKKRYGHAVRLWNQGYEFTRNLVLLGGKRDADPTRENLTTLNKQDAPDLQLDAGAEAITTVPPTEDLIMEALLKRFDAPAIWREKYQLVSAPKQPDRLKPDPSADDTIRAWLQDHKPEPGHCLFFYSQPSVMHLWVAASKILVPLGFTVEVVGYQPPIDTLNVSQALDAVAKVIHELVA